METISIDLTRIFVKVVQHGSFTKAAEIMQIPKSTVSKSLARLEKETGTKLLLRTTRSLTLTSAGRAFYETCLGPIQILEDAQKSLYGQDSIVNGTIRLTGPEDLGYQVISPLVGELSRKYPNLSFELNFTNQIVDLIKDGYDLAIRIGALSESSLKAKKIGFVVLIPVASPAYLKSVDKIKVPKDLESLVGLSIDSGSLRHSWVLRNKKEVRKVSIRSQVMSNQVSSLLKMAAAGAGIAFLPHFLCKSEIESGRLIRVLPDWSGTEIPISLVSPLATASSARLKLVGDQLFSAIQKALQFN